MQSANNEVGVGCRRPAQAQQRPTQRLCRALQSPTMKALFVFLVNTSPFNVTVYSLRKTKKGKWRGRWVSFCRGHLLKTTRLKVHGHRKSSASGQLLSVSTTRTSKKASHSLSGALDAPLLFPTHHSIQKGQNALSSTSVKDLRPIISLILLDGTAEGLTSAPGVSECHIPRGTSLKTFKTAAA